MIMSEWQLVMLGWYACTCTMCSGAEGRRTVGVWGAEPCVWGAEPCVWRFYLLMRLVEHKGAVTAQTLVKNKAHTYSAHKDRPKKVFHFAP